MAISTAVLRTGNHTCPILTGTSSLARLPVLLRRLHHGKRLFVFYDASVYALHAQQLQAILRGTRAELIVFTLPPGETAKTAACWQGIQSFLLANGVARDDFILAVGGGATIDVVGFAAATILRGVQWGVISTTLLSMVDAGIGGKTAINHSSGKNLIGAIWQPSFVINDPSFLTTLPQRELNSGMGELVKYAGLCGGSLLVRTARLSASQSSAFPSRLLADAAAFKASVVSADERETGQRAILNFGHTIGHAVETSVGYSRIRHGEAVLLGLYGAVLLSRQYARTNATPEKAAWNDYMQLLEQQLTLLPKLKLDGSKIHAQIKSDKKRSQKGQLFVLISEPGKPILRVMSDLQAITSAIDKTILRYAELQKRRPR